MYCVGQRVNDVLREMLLARGYQQIQPDRMRCPDGCDETWEDYCRRRREIVDNWIARSDKVVLEVSVMVTASTVGVDTLRDIQSRRLPHCILIGSTKPTPSFKGGVRDNEIIETFTFRELLSNITKHPLFLPHRRLDENERTNVERQYQIQHLPKLRRDDAVCRFYGFIDGELIAILRPDGVEYIRHVV